MATEIPGIPIQAIIFLAAIGIVLIGPLIVDQIIQYRFTKKKLEKLGEVDTKDRNIFEISKPSPTAGLYRSLMTFGVILLVGAMLLYVLGILGNYLQPVHVTIDSFKSYTDSNKNLTENQTEMINNLLVSQVNSANAMSLTMLNIIKDIATILGGAVSAIVGFYFGNKAATDAVPEKPTPTPEETTPPTTPPPTTPPPTTPPPTTPPPTTEEKSTPSEKKISGKSTSTITEKTLSKDKPSS